MTWYCGITTPNRTGKRFCRRTITMDSQTCFLRVNLRVPVDVRCSSKRPTCDTVVGGPLHHIWRTRRVTAEGAVPLRLREYLQSTFLVSWKLIKLPLSLEQRIAAKCEFPSLWLTRVKVRGWLWTSYDDWVEGFNQNCPKNIKWKVFLFENSGLRPKIANANSKCS